MNNSEQPINPIPCVNGHGDIVYNLYCGLTKREYFASAAMQGLLSIYDSSNGLVPNSENITYMAMVSVEASDALLDALSKNQE